MGIAPEGQLSAIDGHRFRSLVAAALGWLRQHQETVNSLNVFPVPDGDTGTNMTLTMTSAWEEIAHSHDSDIHTVSSAMAHGALMGARGNSGVILSQIWRGFARGLTDVNEMRVPDCARAFRMAAETAYKGVVKPVEGTILTVIREVSEEATRVENQTHDLQALFMLLVERAKLSVANTPNLLPVLKQAGVVDSGGQGLLMILTGMLRELQGHAVPAVDAPIDQAGTMAFSADSGHLDFDENYPYDVQFLIIGHGMDVDAIRTHIESLGDCPLTVGDSETIKIHVHVADPGAPISFGARHGSVQDVVVEDMKAQFEAFSAARDANACNFGPGMILPVSLLQAEDQNIGVVAISAGSGLADVFRSLGATAIVEGGQTMNPSTADIICAAEQIKAPHVIILPNNKNILMAAQQAAEHLSLDDAREVVVVPTRSIPQGIGALLSLDQNATLDSNALAMARCASDIITGEVTWAVRDVEINGLHVKQGNAIGLLDDQLVVNAETFGEAVRWLIAEVDVDDRELITLYYGEGVDEAEAEALVEELEESYPDLEFELVNGGQPHYPYLLSME